LWLATSSFKVVLAGMPSRGDMRLLAAWEAV
jgi:hypothetical protein